MIEKDSRRGGRRSYCVWLWLRHRRAELLLHLQKRRFRKVAVRPALITRDQRRSVYQLLRVDRRQSGHDQGRGFLPDGVIQEQWTRRVPSFGIASQPST